MICFKKIRWRNFLSTGNQFTEISFTDHATTLIVGTNGAGKSTVLDALTFVLFNKPFRRINKPQLLNSQNEKDCLVEIEFSTASVDWLIRRGMKPNIFEIYRNGQMLSQSSDAKDDQRNLEQNILKLNYKSFTQIVVLGSSTFVPFMQLPAAHRREVIEDLLDIKVFSSMNGIVKDRIRSFNEEIRTIESNKNLISEKIGMQKNFIAELESSGNTKINTNKEKIAKLEDEIGDFMSHNSTVESTLSEKTTLQEQLITDGSKLVKLNNLKGKISQKISTITKEYKFFQENTVCPTCTQSIEDEFRLNKITDAQNKTEELEQGFKDLEQTIKEEEQRERQFNTLSKEITSLTHEISQNNTKISGCQRQIRDLESEVQTIAEQLQNRNSEHEKLKLFQKDLQDKTKELSTKKEQIVYHDFIYSLLKDGGVKSKIIKNYLPLINQQVNRYLQMMDFYINFQLDEEFNESIKSPLHENFSYASFSEGEKMRVDLSLLFTWREVARIKNSVNTNLLIMDEVFDSSLDGFGTDEFLKIIRYIIKDANIFVISHKSDLNDKFEHVLKFEKVKGFSKLRQ
ncbi:recombination endonuclease subunit [Synechococcus phage DSL-LC02]|nr:recombination endonuclease subunit [Synechococcus phage DSL-LC02]